MKFSEALQKAASLLGKDPEDISRREFRQAKLAPEPKNWSAAKAEALGLDAPLEVQPERHRIKGVSTLVDADGETKLQWIKTDSEAESREELLTRLVQELPLKVVPREGVVPLSCIKADPSLLAVYPMGDPHIGMMSWAPETGDNFDLNIATRLVQDAFDSLTEKLPRAETALILNLGDFFHTDSAKNETTRGTAVDVDGRFYKILQMGRDLMIYAIDSALRHHSKVVVENRIGNHDENTSLFLSLALDLYYKNEPRVQINTNPSAFFYYRFGRNLIGSTHGDKAKRKDLQKIMSVDRRKDWGEIDHAYWYLGHEHHTRRVEDYGCIMETFRTLCPSDAWHHGQGYRSGRDMHRILIHREHGEVSRSLVTAASLERKYQVGIIS